MSPLKAAQKPPKNRSDDSPSYRFITVARAEVFWIEKARKDPLAFIYYVSGKKPAQHHIDWVTAILSNKRVNIIGPRESAKTTVAIYLMAWLIAKDPMKTHFIGSVSAGQAEDRLDMVREIIDQNARFKNVFPYIHIDYKKPSNKSEFTVWSSEGGQDYGGYRTKVSLNGDMKNPTICAFGIGSSQVIGKRISGLALIDDIHSEANSATAALRQKVDDWFNRTFLPLITQSGRVCVICTRWAPDDQSGRLKEKVNLDGTPIWVTLETAALSKDGKTSYWPEFWPVERLDAKRAEIGEVMFQLMYMNNPLGLSASMFTIEMLRKDLPDPLPEFKSIVISLDLAITEKTSSDYSVFAAIARDVKPRYYDMYVLDIVRDKISSEKLIDAVIEFCNRMAQEYTIDCVLYENQALTISSINEFRARETIYKLQPVSLIGDKGARLMPVSLKAQRGGFYVNMHAQAYAAM